MTAFPPALEEMISRHCDVFQSEYPYINAVGRARTVMKIMTKKRYGFHDQLRTGNFAPYTTEAIIENISGDNCTTIIPDAYLYCHYFGLNPEIVRFVDFWSEDDDDKPRYQSHYALLVHVGRKQPFLMDPFHSLFGPVLELDEEEGRMRIGKHGEYNKVTRRFRELQYYTEEEMARLMEHWKTPAGSLDMLIAGQQIEKNLWVHKTSCSLMLYYDDQENIITTRLYIPQVGIRDKVIYCHIKADNEGNPGATWLELWRAKGDGWNDLIGGEKIAETTFAEMEKLRRVLKPAISLKEYERIGPALYKKRDLWGKAMAAVPFCTQPLEEWVQKEDVERRARLFFLRGLYEHESPEQEYVFSARERKNLLYESEREIWRLLHKETPLQQRTWKLRYGMLYERQPGIRRKKLREAESEKRKITGPRKELEKRLTEHVQLRVEDAKLYERHMDMVLFVQQRKGRYQEPPNVDGHREDIQLGHLAMVADYLPYVLKARNYLELTRFWDVLQPKIAARQQRR